MIQVNEIEYNQLRKCKVVLDWLFEQGNSLLGYAGGELIELSSGDDGHGTQVFEVISKEDDEHPVLSQSGDPFDALLFARVFNAEQVRKLLADGIIDEDIANTILERVE